MRMQDSNNRIADRNFNKNKDNNQSSNSRIHNSNNINMQLLKNNNSLQREMVPLLKLRGNIFLMKTLISTITMKIMAPSKN